MQSAWVLSSILDYLNPFYFPIVWSGSIVFFSSLQSSLVPYSLPWFHTVCSGSIQFALVPYSRFWFHTVCSGSIVCSGSTQPAPVSYRLLQFPTVCSGSPLVLPPAASGRPGASAAGSWRTSAPAGASSHSCWTSRTGPQISPAKRRAAMKKASHMRIRAHSAEKSYTIGIWIIIPNESTGTKINLKADRWH